MNSSTSSSERPSAAAKPAAGMRWQRFIRISLAAGGLLLATFFAAAILIDPYDSGRSPLSLKQGVRPQGPRTAAASRGRDLAFSGAIFGNSHIQLVKPDLLKTLTGIPFVSLIAPATGPKETLVLIDWYLRHRQEPAKALVISVDHTWCTPDPAMPVSKPFPFWLFSRNFAEYLFGLMRYDIVEELPRRIRYEITNAPDRARPDGYWDYEAGYVGLGYVEKPALRRRLLEHQDMSGGNETGPFPAATALAALLEAEARGAPVVLVRPPLHITALPAPGSPEVRAEAACRAAFQALADERPATKLVDLRRDTPLIREPSNFFDHSHYRQIVAREVETSIAAALTSLR